MPCAAGRPRCPPGRCASRRAARPACRRRTASDVVVRAAGVVDHADDLGVGERPVGGHALAQRGRCGRPTRPASRRRPRGPVRVGGPPVQRRRRARRGSRAHRRPRPCAECLTASKRAALIVTIRTSGEKPVHEEVVKSWSRVPTASTTSASAARSLAEVAPMMPSAPPYSGGLGHQGAAGDGLDDGHPVGGGQLEHCRDGTGQRIEGNFRAGDEVVVVEDVITTGGSAEQAIAAVVSAGGIVLGVLAVVDREEGGRGVLERAGRRVVALTTATDLNLK